MLAISYVVFVDDNKVLLQLRDGTGFMDGYWSIAAAGHVEPNEDSMDAALREAREELGVEIRSADLRLFISALRQEPFIGANEVVDDFYLATCWSGTPQIMEPDRAADLRWFDISQLPDNVVPHERPVLLELLQD